MELYDKSRDKLKYIEDNLNTTNLNRLDTILSSTKENIKDVLMIDKMLLVNDEVKTRITAIKNRLECVASPTTLVGEIHNEITTINSSGLTATEKHDRISPYLKFVGGTHTTPGNGNSKNTKKRFDEYEALEDLANNLDITTPIPTSTVDIGATTFTGGGAIDLNTIFGSRKDPDSLKFVDDNGNEIKNNGGKYTVKFGGQTVTIEGLSIDPISHELDITSTFKISPENINLSKPLKLNILGQFKGDDKTGHIDTATIKSFELTINNPNIQDQSERGNRFDEYNTNGGGHKIQDRLATDYTRDLYKKEREALIRAMKRNDGTKYDKYLNTPEKQEAFYQRIRNIAHPNGGGNFFDRLHIDLAGNHTALDNYTDFRTWFVCDDRDWNKEEQGNIKDATTYMAFIHNNLEDKVGEYFDASLDSQMIDEIGINTFLKSELTAFATETDQTREENNTHLGLEGDITGHTDRMETTNRDQNYLRFFTGSKWETQGEKIDLNMNRGPEDIDNPEQFKYDMSIEMKGRNNIQVHLDIEGQKPFSLTSGDLHALIQRIMQRRDIHHGSARVHIAYSIMKGFIQMAKEKSIDLSYFCAGVYHHIDIDEKTGNLILRDIDRRSINYTEKIKTIFDYQAFKNTPSFDDNSPRGLRQGIDNSLLHFTHAMNGVHEQYREANRRRFRGLLRSRNRFYFPKLKSIGEIEFSTSVDSPAGTITISCKRNTFTLSGGPLKKEISGKDLGKLMNKRLKGERIFDGVELETVEKIYSAMITTLREQKHIQQSNFGVRDPRTGKLYVLDRNGNCGVILNEEIVAEGNPIRGNRNAGQIDDNVLVSGITLLDDQEKKHLLRNPELMYRLLNTMGDRAKFFNLRNGRMVNRWRNLGR